MNLIFKIKTYHRWWRAWGTFPVDAWVKAAALYRSGKFAEAIELYRAGLKSHADHPARTSAHIDLAYCLFRIGEVEEAQKELKAVLSANPSSKEAYLRLAGIQLWIGQFLEAAWTMHRTMRNVDVDAEIVGTLLYAVVQHGGPQYLLSEAMRESEKLAISGESHPRLQIARALYKLSQGESGKAMLELEALATEPHASRDAVLTFAEVLVKEGKIAQARQHLRRLMSGSCEHPRVLSLLSESYLKSGPFYNSDYAVQLAVTACQRSGWASPREMHVLAEAYYHAGDKIAALLVASKAKDAGSKLLGTYPEQRNLQKLIEDLSVGTQA